MTKKFTYIQRRFTLRRAHQRYLFMSSKHHKRDAFLMAIQLLVVKIEYISEHKQNVLSV